MPLVESVVAIGVGVPSVESVIVVGVTVSSLASVVVVGVVGFDGLVPVDPPS